MQVSHESMECFVVCLTLLHYLTVKPCVQEYCSPCYGFTSPFSVRAGVLVGHGVDSAGLYNMQRRVSWISVTRNRFILNA